MLDKCVQQSELEGSKAPLRIPEAVPTFVLRNSLNLVAELGDWVLLIILNI